jgi:hypothetical protein
MSVLADGARSAGLVHASFLMLLQSTDTPPLPAAKTGYPTK